uniref:Asp_Arg_Hydrox domain-containing protein n=1 Tax=Elaeophora elaphi TaxID=1147741 RepID=A0A0R3RSC5_9BILA
MPMAVMVTPNRVDYSMTKGGLRLWAVLLVFVILCSSFYTLFSTMELAEVAFEIDDDENLDYDGDIDDGEDEMAIHNRRAEKDTTPSREYTPRSRTFEENRKAHQSIQNVPDSTDDDRLDEEEELEKEEEARLADLRAKAERKSSKKSDEAVENIEHDDSNGGSDERDDNGLNEIRELAVNKHLEEEEEEKAEKNSRTGGKEDEKQERSKRAKAHHKLLKVMEDDDEVEGGDDGKKEEGKVEEEEKEEEKKDGNEIQLEDDKERKAEQSGVEHEGEESKDGYDGEKKSRVRSRRKIPSSDMEKSKRECKRKNCLPEYDRHPRMSLLKQIPLSMSNRNKQQVSTSLKPSEEEEEQDEMEEAVDEGEDGDVEEDEIDDAIIHDLIASKKEKLNDRIVYKRHAITNRDDHKYRNQLDRADYLVEKHDYHSAIAIFENVLRANPDSPRAHFGIARANDIRSEIESDLSLLNIAISEYQEVLDIDDTPDALFNQAAYRLIDRARFRGLLHRVLQAQRSLIDRYPDDLQLYNNQGLTFLMMGREDDARRIFENASSENFTNKWCRSGIFWLYFENERRFGKWCAIYAQRFYYHFGEALTRLGKKEEAYRVYSIGAKVGLFPSPYQRSIFNVEGLTARPWWSIEQTFCSKHLKAKIERQWTVIREEAAAILNNQPYLFEPEHTELTIDGQWSAYSLYSSNSWNLSNCLKVPKTCNIMRMFKDSSDCLKSEIKFSLLASGTRVWPHCGYSNYRLQAHLGLIISSEARLRVGQEERGWKTGRFIVFDDSFEQELWFEGASANKYRLILRVDLWHPEVDPVRRVEFRSV